MPETPDDHVELTTTEARGGSRGRTVWIMLAISLIAVIVAFVAVYMYYG